jgi:hypothetical protein
MERRDEGVKKRWESPVRFAWRPVGEMNLAGVAKGRWSDGTKGRRDEGTKRRRDEEKRKSEGTVGKRL